MHAVGIVAAAGSGLRLGADLPKALVRLSGRPLVCWAVATGLHVLARLVPAVALAGGRPAVPGGRRRLAAIALTLINAGRPGGTAVAGSSDAAAENEAAVPVAMH